ncbi:MAG TPA: MDR family MFS transporter [Chloroflexia bacterium]|nr:MDR family MFS transporter [Chloroflexia bacterium]
MSKRNNTEAAVAVQPASENKKILLALSGILFSILLAALDQTVVSPAMPRIVEELQGFSLFAWVTTAYLLTSTATIPIAGKLGDMFGRKFLLIAAVVIFLLGSALSGAAPSMIWLVIFRGLQGIGAGALQANAFAEIAELFPDSAKRARWQGFIAAVFGLSSVIGPFLGGFITDNLQWRWVFYVNVPVGVLAVLALFLYLPHSSNTGQRKIDWWGAAAITGAVVSLLLALTWGGQKEPNGYPWVSPQILGLLAGTLVLAGLFIFIETKAAEPIVPLHLFKLGAVRSVAGISLGLGAALLGATLYIPLFVQVVQGQSASGSGAITTPLAIAMVIANIFTGQFIGRVGILRFPLFSGAIFSVAGMGLLTTLNVNSPIWEVTLYMIVLGLGIGQIMPTMTIVVQESVQRRDLGSGISTVQFFRSIGSTIGVAVIGTIVNNSYTANVNSTPGINALPPQLVAALQEPQNLINKQVASILPPNLIQDIREALSNAIHNGFLLGTIVMVVMLAVVFTVPAIRVKSDLKRKNLESAASTDVPGTAGSMPHRQIMEGAVDAGSLNLSAADGGAADGGSPASRNKTGSQRR